MKEEDEGVGNLLAARVVPALPNYVSTFCVDGRRSRLNRWEAWVVGGLSIRARNLSSVSLRQSDSPRPTGRGEATRCHSPQLN